MLSAAAPGTLALLQGTTGELAHHAVHGGAEGGWDYRLVALSYAVAVLASYAALDLGDRVRAARGLSRAGWLAAGAVLMGAGIWGMHFTGMLASRAHGAGAQYDLYLTVLSMVAAVAASALALGVVGVRRMKLGHLARAAPVMGGGIVTMHYTGMAAMQVSGEISYRPALFALSVLIAVSASAAAMLLAFRLSDEAVRPVRKLLLKLAAAFVMGLAIAGMHYTGMYAAVMPPTLTEAGTGRAAIIGSSDLGLWVGLITAVALGATLTVSGVNRRFAVQGARLRSFREKSQAILEQMEEGYFETDLFGTITEVNDALTRTSGYSRESLLGSDFRSYTSPEGLAMMQRNLESILASGSPVRNVECDFRGPRGETLYFEVSAGLMRNERNRAVGFRGIMRDITRRKQTERSLRESEERFRNLFEQSVDALLLHDEHGRMVDCNEEACRSLGYTREELLSMSVRDFATRLIPEDTEEHDRGPTLWERAMKSEPGRILGYHSGEHKRKDGTTFPVEVGVGAFELGGRRLIFASARDVTERKLLEQKLAHQATHDALTGLPNRYLFNQRLGLALKSGAAGEENGGGPGRVTVLFLDLDDFKVVNDSLGHRVGDALLVAAAGRLGSAVPEGGTVARFGGDEFTVLLPNAADEAQVILATQKIVEALRAPFALDGRELFVNTSVGAALGRPRDTPEEVLRRADIALYSAKLSGKGRFEVFNETMDKKTTARLDLELDLRRAVKSGEMSVHYQPVVRLNTGELSGLEALARWEHPVRGTVSPAEFIPLAEETGLIHQIGAHVLESACARLVDWQTRYPGCGDLRMSVNLSVRQLQNPDLVEEVQAILSRTGVDPKDVVLEITESMVMQEAEGTGPGLGTLGRLKDLGLSLAVDDFGTGYSSLSQLRRFPVDVLKIDRSFVDGLGRAPEDRAIVETVVKLADALDLEVVAEGIETPEQLGRLKQLGCALGQGYLFSRPLPAGETERLLAADRSPGPDYLKRSRSGGITSSLAEEPSAGT
ncbi:GGDEF: diguanylate cyclase (GGDEF) domain [Rubrobacter radiotolerans]|uniref:EAL domain-containing protein n=1 Tax=Rubrobacter radiotolerans TaxID=42256 RepID=A0A023X2D4_RUBRA|nr:EAL domain-containing protein [Rubrobacter radiotolerans]AHY46155.1 GGDEF: diguanylate cyclase (GGDEF) domain [Rubrobacter radiotolerans]MDX5893565.1 EAL domain-containing protein [Rubrobacter radiotolerans]SMC04004.1 PAS domain S-box-containing protein/diguanylate cyclase (GGDEF) domain-containing protein [Rubrobacter radiotolerans DSM 5868]